MMNWGSDVTVLCISDFNFLPGAYGLFNSLVCNGFEGKFRIIKINEFDDEEICSHTQIEIDQLYKKEGNFHNNVQRWNCFEKLSAGKYLFLDADIIVERPIGFLLDLIHQSVLVSKESEPKYDSYDILYQRQAKTVGYDPFISKGDIGYINGGLLGFSLPVHQKFIDELVKKSFDHLEDYLVCTEDPDWFFIDQDMLNVILRGVECPVSVISPRLLEMSNYPNDLFYNRSFPAEMQNNVYPKDQLKYIIHGAALRRPWLNSQSETFVSNIKKKLYNLGVTALKKKPTPYERAWAYYTCSNNMPIPIDAWAQKHKFSAYKNKFWRLAHGI